MIDGELGIVDATETCETNLVESRVARVRVPGHGYQDVVSWDDLDIDRLYGSRRVGRDFDLGLLMLAAVWGGADYPSLAVRWLVLRGGPRLHRSTVGRRFERFCREGRLERVAVEKGPFTPTEAVYRLTDAGKRCLKRLQRMYAGVLYDQLARPQKRWRRRVVRNKATGQRVRAEF